MSQLTAKLQTGVLAFFVVVGGAPLPRSMAWRTPSRSTTTAVTV